MERRHQKADGMRRKIRLTPPIIVDRVKRKSRRLSGNSPKSRRLSCFLATSQLLLTALRPS
jgi:hypothetical protein